MLEFDEARSLLISRALRSDPPRERVELGACMGRVLAEDVLSPLQVPSADYSAMDGYALRHADLAEAGPWELPVVGECRAGHPAAAVAPGSCARIFTGAHIPEGADTVVIQENVAREGEIARLLELPPPGSNIRRAGEDLEQGQLALPRGTRLGGFQLALLASVERVQVLVARRPRVVIVCTGDELRAPGQPGAPGLAESNSAALLALVEQAGGLGSVAPIVGDGLEEMAAALRSASQGADLVITVGGVSVGDHDVVRPALERLGAESVFWKVKMKPGKPLLASRLGETWVLGLPGNPSSALITFALFGLPLLRALAGDKNPVALPRQARLTMPLHQKGGRTGLYAGRLLGDQVEPLANQASGTSTAVAWGDCLLRLDADVQQAEAGRLVSVYAYVDL